MITVIPGYPPIKRDDTGHYSTPLGYLPSVTTVKRNGETFPDGYIVAAENGNAIHALMESAFTGRYVGGLEENQALRFSRFVSLYETAIVRYERPYAVEIGIWSSLGYAGRIDAICKLKGNNRHVLVDWKSGREFSQDRILRFGYLMQCAAYAHAWNERATENTHTRMPHVDGVELVCVDARGVVQIFEYSMECDKFSNAFEDFADRLAYFTERALA